MRSLTNKCERVGQYSEAMKGVMNMARLGGLIDDRKNAGGITNIQQNIIMIDNIADDLGVVDETGAIIDQVMEDISNE